LRGEGKGFFGELDKKCNKKDTKGHERGPDAQTQPSPFTNQDQGTQNLKTNHRRRGGETGRGKRKEASSQHKEERRKRVGDLSPERV